MADGGTPSGPRDDTELDLVLDAFDRVQDRLAELGAEVSPVMLTDYPLETARAMLDVELGRVRTLEAFEADYRPSMW